MYVNTSIDMRRKTGCEKVQRNKPHSSMHILVLILLGGGVIAAPCRGNDWPKWRGNDARNAVSAETNLPAQFIPGTTLPDATNTPPSAPQPTHLKWKVHLNTHACGGPVVADGKVYVGTDTGDLWTFAASRELNIPAKTKLDSAISASPIAANGVLYVMTQHWLYAAANETTTGEIQ